MLVAAGCQWPATRILKIKSEILAKVTEAPINVTIVATLEILVLIIDKLLSLLW